MKPAPAMSRRRLTDGTVEQAAAAKVRAAMNVNIGSSRICQVADNVAVVADVVVHIKQVIKEITHLIAAAVTQCVGSIAILIGLMSQATRSAREQSLVELVEGEFGGVHSVVAMNWWNEVCLPAGVPCLNDSCCVKSELVDD